MGRHMTDVDRINVLGIYLKMTEGSWKRSRRIRTTVDIFAERYGRPVTAVQVLRLLERVPYDGRPEHETRGGHNLIRPAFREAILQELLSTPKDQFSCRKVAKKLGISGATVARILREDLKPVRRNRAAAVAAAAALNQLDPVTPVPAPADAPAAASSAPAAAASVTCTAAGNSPSLPSAAPCTTAAPAAADLQPRPLAVADAAADTDKWKESMKQVVSPEMNEHQ